MNIVLLGLPGSGKGTQGTRLAARLEIPHISSGAIFRGLSGQDALGQQLRAYMAVGEYVPDPLANEIVLARLNTSDAAHGFILDGYPRTLPQAVSLDAALEREGRAIDAALDITVPESMAVERMMRRSVLEGRADDTTEVIRHRLEVYLRGITPVLDHYARMGKLHTVNGAQALDTVTAEVDRALGV